MTDDASALTAALQAKLEAQELAALAERLVAIVLARNWSRHADDHLRLARVLHHADEGPEGEPSPELVARIKQCLNTAFYWDCLIDARANKKQWVQNRALGASPEALEEIIWLASKQNDDKRTRTSNAQFLVAAGAGVSPSTKVEAGEDLLSLAQQMMAGYNPPKADGGKAE